MVFPFLNNNLSLKDGLGQLQRIQTYLGISKSDESLQGILNRTSINTLREEINSKKVFSPFLDKNGESIIFRKGRCISVYCYIQGTYVYMLTMFS